MGEQAKRLAAVCALSAAGAVSAGLVPAMAALGAAFPARTGQLQLLLTLPPLFVMAVSLTTDWLLERVSARRLALVGLLLVCVAGAAPCRLDRFELILLSRALLGVGQGLCAALSASLPAALFEPGRWRDRAVGWQAAFLSAGSVAVSLLVGFLTVRGWRTAFLSYLVLLPALPVILICLPETEKRERRGFSLPVRFVREGLFCCVLGFCFTAVTVSFPLGLSDYVAGRAFGGAGLVGILSAVNAWIGFLIGLGFEGVARRFGRRTLPMGVLLTGAGFGLVAAAPGVAALFAGSLLIGLGSSAVAPALLREVYRRVPGEKVVAAVGMYLVGNNVAQFVSPYLINPFAAVFAPGVGTRYLVCAALLALPAAVALGVGARPRRNGKS